MKIYVQLGEAPIPANERVNYRVGFRNLVPIDVDPAETKIVLAEPNSGLHQDLRNVWAATQEIEIVTADISLTSVDGHSTFFFKAGSHGLLEVFSAKESYVRRYFPSGELSSTEVQTRNLESFLHELASHGSLEVVSMDLRRQNSSNFSDIDWSSLPVKSLVLTTEGMRPSEMHKILGILKKSGYLAAGRSFGDANTGVTYRRPDSLSERINAIASQFRVNSGALLEKVDSRKTWLLGKSDSLEQIDINDVEDLIDLIDRNEFEIDPVRIIDDVEVQQLVDECFETHGYWPISFSYPREHLFFNQEPELNLSPITPGFPYSFTDERDYVRTYGNARLAITHRKAGWDCFRHIEILASGSVPLMADIRDVPKYSMVHYPKSSMRKVLGNVESISGIPLNETRQAFQDFFSRHLTSRAMAEYLLRIAANSVEPRVLFIDESLPKSADYLSVMTLIGLKQVLGSSCDVLYPVDYIYVDTTIDTSRFYGRGFGYTKVVEPNLRGNRELNAASAQEIHESPEFDYDLVVVGSIARNRSLATEMLKSVDPKRMVWIHGEDRPPEAQDLRVMKESGVHLFIRSIEG